MRPSLLVMLCVLSHAAIAVGDPSKEAIESWAKRREGIRTAKFIARAKVYVAKGSYGPSLKDKKILMPLTDLSFDEYITLYIDLENGQVRRDFHSQLWDADVESLRPWVGYVIFDGKQIGLVQPYQDNRSERYEPSPRKPEVFLTTKSPMLWQIASPGELPMYFSVGLICTYHTRQRFKSLADMRLDSNRFNWRAEKTDDIEKTILLAKESPFEELHFRSDWLGAITSLSQPTRANPLELLEIEYDGTVAKPMPTRWTHTTRRTGDFRKEWTLDSHQFNLPIDREQFILPIQDKQIIVKDKVVYHLSKDGKWTPDRRRSRDPIVP